MPIWVTLFTVIALSIVTELLATSWAPSRSCDYSTTVVFDDPANVDRKLRMSIQHSAGSTSGRFEWAMSCSVDVLRDRNWLTVSWNDLSHAQRTAATKAASGQIQSGAASPTYWQLVLLRRLEVAMAHASTAGEPRAEGIDAAWVFVGVVRVIAYFNCLLLFLNVLAHALEGFYLSSVGRAVIDCKCARCKYVLGSAGVTVCSECGMQNPLLLPDGEVKRSPDPA